MNAKTSRQRADPDDNWPTDHYKPLAVIFYQAPDWNFFGKRKTMKVADFAAFACDLNHTPDGRSRWPLMAEQAYRETCDLLADGIASGRLKTFGPNMERISKEVALLFLTERGHSLPRECRVQRAGSPRGSPERFSDERKVIDDFLSGLIDTQTTSTITAQGPKQYLGKIADHLGEQGLPCPGTTTLQEIVREFFGSRDIHLKGQRPR